MPAFGQHELDWRRAWLIGCAWSVSSRCNARVMPGNSSGSPRLISEDQGRRCGRLRKEAGQEPTEPVVAGRNHCATNTRLPHLSLRGGPQPDEAISTLCGIASLRPAENGPDCSQNEAERPERSRGRGPDVVEGLRRELSRTMRSGQAKRPPLRLRAASFDCAALRSGCGGPPRRALEAFGCSMVAQRA
jgi:hypothetical protein